MVFATVTVSDKGQVSIPKKVRQELGIKEGEKLVLTEDNGRLVLQHSKDVERKLSMLNRGESLATMLASEKALAGDWGSKEDERWDNV